MKYILIAAMAFCTANFCAAQDGGEHRGKGRSESHEKGKSEHQGKGKSDHDGSEHGRGKSGEYHDNHDKDSVKHKGNHREGEGREGDGDKEDNDSTEGKGHAWGKHKDSMGGRQFGEARRDSAKAMHYKTKTHLDSNLRASEKKHEDAENTIKKEREKLEADKKSGKISEAEYKRRDAKIKAAETALKNARQKREKAKEVHGKN